MCKDRKHFENICSPVVSCNKIIFIIFILKYFVVRFSASHVLAMRFVLILRIVFLRSSKILESNLYLWDIKFQFAFCRSRSVPGHLLDGWLWLTVPVQLCRLPLPSLCLVSITFNPMYLLNIMLLCIDDVTEYRYLS